MQKILATLAVVGTIAAVALFNGQAPSSTFLKQSVESGSEVEMAFHRFLGQYGQNIGTKEEYAMRFQIFSQNYHKIMHHNMMQAETKGYTMAMNKFGAMTDAEYKRMLGFKGASRTGKAANLSTASLPASVDWRGKAVSGVKNQGQCGSCWAFSTVGAMEGAYALKHGKIQTFSEQQLVDCSKQNNGCNGGLMDYAFQYLEKNALDSEAAYPYEGVDGRCQSSGKKGIVETTGFTDVTQQSPSALMAAIAKAPVAVAIEADQSAFQFYNSGVLKSGCGSNLDHGVLAVGYGTENGSDYYLVKNSWGASWGEKGYIKLLRTNTKGAGMCGIQMSASYPQI
jgi:C1A family cysteine protease